MSSAGSMTGRTLGGRYELGERIGVGGMAEVYVATDTTLGRTVAVKVMLPQYADDPDFARRFRQEAAAAANLQSPYIVNVYDWGHEGDTYYIVMEYVRGSDLKTAIQERGAINQRKVAEIGMQVCQALAVAHAQDIIHRDIKPQNIMVQPDGNVKVMDFGIARAKNSNSDKTQTVLGTAHYISPEQAQGKTLTPASDIYSLGIVMYEAATGTLPFDGPDAVSVALMQVKDFPRDMREINPDISPDFDDIVMAALDKEPGRRFATVNDMRKALGDFLAGRSVSHDFTSAQTSVIAPIGAAAGGVQATQVMPVTPGAAGSQGSHMGGTTSYRAGNTKKQKMSGKKKGIIIAICVIAAIAIAAVAAFALMGGEKVKVPDLKDMTSEQAVKAIEEAGFQVGKVDNAHDENVEAGHVISQDPKADSEAEKGSKINLVISQGIEDVTVPNVTDMKLDKAKEALTKAGLVVGTTEQKYSEKIDSGNVISQDPEANSTAKKGTKVNLVVSKGVESNTVPDIEGMSLEAARSKAQSSGFSIEQMDSEYSDKVSEGCIIRQSPGAGSSLEKGSSITYVISLGPKIVTVSVPSLIGLSEAGAKSTLSNANLKASVSYEYSDDVAKGNVISQTVAAGTNVEEKSSVGIVVSKGPLTPTPTPTQPSSQP